MVKDMTDQAGRLDKSDGRHYSRLYFRFILFTMACSLLPLLLVGWAINNHYARFAESRMLDIIENEVKHHRKLIEMFLQEQSSRLQFVTRTHTMDQLTESLKLNSIFEELNRGRPAFSDLGVIDDEGKHLAYFGPYDLMQKNYAQTFWFERVMQKGIFISDMFMGFRQVPHFVIAVMREVDGRKWILRATVNTVAFRALVENVAIGKTGEVYLLNQEGLYQTTPRFRGEIMEKSRHDDFSMHDGIMTRVEEAVDSGGRDRQRRIVSQAWLDDPHWLLVVKQDYAEAFYSIHHTQRMILIFLHVGAITIFIAVFFITRKMVGMIRKRDEEADSLNRQLMQTGKLAAIGELAAGVAHEINNPLAIILTEKQLLIDQKQKTQEMDPGFLKQFDQSMEQIRVQVNRCKQITQNLLRFSRRTKSMTEWLDLNAFLIEIIELMKREAETSGIQFVSELEENLPMLKTDPSQLQQVFLNLIKNAIDAHDKKPYGTVRIITHSHEQEHGVEMRIIDTGCGVPPQNINRIFDPFFTTKPVGSGTGLGLSICFSIIKQLGGYISVTSEPGLGTEFYLFLPYEPPGDHETVEKDSDVDRH
ncbi:MAG: ATP-binding protein [Planctomycetota bacterium]